MLPAAEPLPGPTMISVAFGIINKIPDDEEIIHIAHAFDNAKLIIQPFPERTVIPQGNVLLSPSSHSLFR